MREARAALAGGMTLDAVSVSVDEAIAAVLELTGERATEAVVDEVFARFLRGKVTQKRIRALYINKSGGNTTVFPPLPV